MKKLYTMLVMLLLYATITNAQYWRLDGNPGTLGGVYFLGTTDNQTLTFKVNNIKAGYLDFDSLKGNTAFGCYAILNNTTGLGNTASGYLSLYQNNTGYYNTAEGNRSLYSNTVGNHNTAIGYNALYSNQTGHSNVAMGVFALEKNVSGNNLVAVGDSALYNLNDDSLGGIGSTAVGSKALYANTNGVFNTATGFQSLYANTTGIGNTAEGAYALNKNKTGDNNTAVGYLAGPNKTKGSFRNTTALGYTAVPTASNQVRAGNTGVTSIGGQVSWTSFSDERAKINIKENVPGLSFINLLRPLTYNFNIVKENELLGIKNDTKNTENNDIEKISFTGFLAQDVDKAAKKIKYDFSGIDKSGDIMGLRYSEFVVPLVKGMQELSRMNDEKDAKINDLQKQIDELKVKVHSILSSENSKLSTVLSSSFLAQNIPNPFNQSTIINYTLPENYSSAKIIITDKNGKALKEVNISGSSKGSLKVDASILAGGAYQYSLYINNHLTDTKQMVLIK